MNSSQIEEGFASLAPWFTKWVIDGRAYGGSYDAYDDIRLRWFFERLGDVRSILELGSFEGGHTARLADHPSVERVVALEGRADNLARARFAHSLVPRANVEFRGADLERVDLAAFGRFDAVACFGVLYHLPHPWELLRQMSRLAPRAYVWTQIAGPADATTVVEGYEGFWQHEFGLADRLSGLSPRSFWPTREALLRMVRDCGYTRVEVIENSAYPEGYPLPPEPFVDLVLET